MNMRNFRFEVTFGEMQVTQFLTATDWQAAKDAVHERYPGWYVGEILEIL